MMNNKDNPSLQLSLYPCRSNAVKLLCGPSEFRWNSLVARVEYVLQYRDRNCVIVLAAGNDPRIPSKHDVLNAKLTAVVVSRQIRFRFSRKPLKTYLKYAHNTQREVEVDLDLTAKMIKQHLAQSRQPAQAHPVPTPALAYLLNMHR